VTYTVLVSPRARRQLDGLSTQLYQRITSKLLDLENDPRPPGCIKLTGREGWRVRVGDYRVLYSIDDGTRVVLVEHIGHRREVYR
jgi:mRNA interferase RelE/StbE